MDKFSTFLLSMINFFLEIIIYSIIKKKEKDYQHKISLIINDLWTLDDKSAIREKNKNPLKKEKNNKSLSLVTLITVFSMNDQSEYASCVHQRN